MAQIAINSTLTKSLIAAINQGSHRKDSKRDENLRIHVDQKLHHHNYGRTNQFEVQKQLRGLDEKLRVLNNDELADALRDRLEELSTLSPKWSPEILSLFLFLSDRPATKSSTQDLEALRPPASPPPLTWSDIIEDAPLNEKDIWENVDFSAETSDDEAGDEDGSRGPSPTTDDTRLSTLEDEQDLAKARACLIPRREVDLRDLEDVQFWKHQTSAGHGRVQSVDKDGRRFITELQAVRETLFMLSGLPTSLYATDSHNRVVVNGKYALRHVSGHPLKLLLEGFAAKGSALNKLRAWTKVDRHEAVMQTLSAAAGGRLRDLNAAVSNTQDRYLQQDSPVVISLIEVEQQIQPHIRPLLSLSKLLCESQESHDSDRGHFRYLEALFDATCASQMVGDETEFTLMAGLFLQCFRTYLRPILMWMRSGEMAEDDETLFIYKTARAAEDKPEGLWHEWYALRKSSSGELHAPRFLHPKISKIITTGKSVAFLNCLHRYPASESRSSADELGLDIDTLTPSGTTTSLIPFSEVFDNAFDALIAAQHRSASTILRGTLFSSCGLWRALDALEYIYLLKDGSIASSIASAIFDRLDRKQGAFPDRYLLTEIYHSHLGSLACIDTDRISCPSPSTPSPASRSSITSLSSLSIQYTLPWPLRNIITAPSLHSYDRVCTLLLQIRRALHHLEPLPSLPRSSPTQPQRLLLLLRHRLLWFAQTLYHHLVSTVITTLTADMRRRMALALDVDAMIAAHATYMSNLEDACLLSKRLKPIHDAVVSMLDLAFQLPSPSPTAEHKPGRTSSHGGDESSSDEDEDEDEAPSAPPAGTTPKSGAGLEEFTTLHAFLVAALRSIARASGGGEAAALNLDTTMSVAASWEGLADRLEWGGS